MRTYLVSLLVCTAAACGPTSAGHSGSGGTGGGGNADGSAGGGGGGGGGSSGPTLSSSCGGASTTLSGVVRAPNGVDPIADAVVYVPASKGVLEPGVSCDLCADPVDQLAAVTRSGTDGHFTLDVSHLPAATVLPFTVAKGRFRRTGTLTVQGCSDNAVGPPHTVLPGKSGPGDDIPRIAVATGIKDALDGVLAAMGVDGTSGYDCFENQPKPVTTPVSVCEKRLAAQGKSAPELTDLLKDPAKLGQYNILFVSCALGKYASLSAADRATIVANLQGWVGQGGRLFATDRSYDYIAQAFPTSIGFVNGAATVDAANVGVGSVSTPASYSGHVNDASLAAWLTAVGVLGAGQTTLPLTGYLTDWSAMQSVPMSTVDEVDATDAQVTISGKVQTGSYPQTVKFDYAPAVGAAACGRVVFSSYHTLGASSSGTALTAQERILEYLMFEAGACVGPIS